MKCLQFFFRALPSNSNNFELMKQLDTFDERKKADEEHDQTNGNSGDGVDLNSHVDIFYAILKQVLLCKFFLYRRITQFFLSNVLFFGESQNYFQPPPALFSTSRTNFNVSFSFSPLYSFLRVVKVYGFCYQMKSNTIPIVAGRSVKTDVGCYFSVSFCVTDFP